MPVNRRAIANLFPLVPTDPHVAAGCTVFLWVSYFGTSAKTSGLAPLRPYAKDLAMASAGALLIFLVGLYVW